MIERLKPYQGYKESGVPWVGEVPAHWEVLLNQRIFRETTRPYAGTDETQLSLSQRAGLIATASMEERSLQTASYDNWKIVVPGDLVLNRFKAHLGVFFAAAVRGIVTFHYGVFRPKRTLETRYFEFLFHTTPYRAIYGVRSNGMTVGLQNLSNQNFYGVHSLLPPVTEQRAILRFLEYADRRIQRYIRAKKRLIALLNEQKQAAIHRAVTHGLNSQVPLKPSGVPWFGDVPQHWDVWQVGHFGRVGNGSTPSRGNPAYWVGGTYPWLNSSSVNRSPISGSDQFVTELALRECHLPRVQPPSVLVAMTGQGKTRGTAALLDTEATINQHIAYITPRCDIVLPEYLQLVLIGAYRELRSISDDSGSTKGALTCADISHFKIALPDLEEQESIIRAVGLETQSLGAAIARSQREVELLSEYRVRLVADVVLGQVDVREVALHLPDAPAGEDEFLDDEAAEAESSELDDAETDVTA